MNLTDKESDMNEVQTYRVVARWSRYFEMTVDAVSEEEAQRYAEANADEYEEIDAFGEYDRLEVIDVFETQ